MKTKEEIKEELEILKSDERLTYETATVFENAPLALIQFGLKSKVNLLEWILEEKCSKFPLKKIKK